MTAIVLIHLAIAVLCFGFGTRLGVKVTLTAAMAVTAASTVWFLSQVRATNGSVYIDRQQITWIEGLDLQLAFRLDGFALLMAIIVSGIGSVVLAYSFSYFGADAKPERIARFAGGFVAFAGSMLGLVLAENVWTLFVFWEGTTIASFVLIGLDNERAEGRTAAKRALIVTAAGGLALLGGLAVISHAAGSTVLGEIGGADTGTWTVQVGLALILFGAVTKSAQVPFQFWLPGAMTAPTPVSAYMHSATMVKAGVILIGRITPQVSDLAWWRPTLVIIGGATMVTGGIGALRQFDAKLILANGTVSQLGFMTVLFGIGTPEATAAGVAVLAAHAVYKATLFLSVGAIERSTGTRDIRRLNLAQSHRALALITGLATLSMAGVLPLAGAIAKESALRSLTESHERGSLVILGLIVVGSAMTTMYGARLWAGMFTGFARNDQEPSSGGLRIGVGFVGPLAFLSGLSLLGGLMSSQVNGLIGAAAASLDPRSHSHLGLWHGFDLPLVLSLAITAGGLGCFVALGTAKVPATRWVGTSVFDRVYTTVESAATRLTATLQNGSLPAYLSIIFAIMTAALAYTAAVGIEIGAAGTTYGSWQQVAVAAFAVALSASIVFTDRRFVAVLMLGILGYSIVVLWMFLDAPDLALTQFLVETVSLIVFLLVLRHLPEGYSPAPEWAPRSMRLGIAVGLGVAVAAFAMAAGTVRTDRPVADRVIVEAKPVGGGANVVNVTIVDIRGIDTSGEIAVLAIAGAGVASLVLAARRSRPSPDLLARQPQSLRATPLNSMILVQLSQAVFPITVMLSIYVAARGHNAPGGGFAGGLIAGCAFALRYLARGGARPPEGRVFKPGVLVGAGLALALGTGISGALFGRGFLDLGVSHAHLWLLGEVELVSAALFDAGVYLLVLGFILGLLRTLGSDTEDGARNGSLAEEPT